ncbi:MAG: DoxX family protein [Chromatiales bacterium]|nr:DoxX family protein [Chromatiales bacterium]
MFSSITGDNIGKLILRLTVGGLMIFHGIAKLSHGVDFIAAKLTENGLPAELAYGVYAGELLAPVLLILGLWSRVGAFIVVVNMVFAVGLMHMGDLLTLTQHGGWRLELQAFFLLGGLAILFLGSGRYAFRPD